MPSRFLRVDRATAMLLPPDLNDWVPVDSPARLIVELVEHLDLSSAAVNSKGTGSAQYPPGMMLALRLHSYSHGIFSSRQIEQSTYEHLGGRYICANYHPDHDTICKFRRENGALIKSTFTQSLQLAGELGILNIGSLTVAQDGTKIKADVNTHATPRLEEIDQQIAKLDEQRAELNTTIEALLKEAKPTYRLSKRDRITRERRDEFYERLRTEENRSLRRRRRETIEPTFGTIKESMGFRRFHLRGQSKVELEWQLVGLSYNLRKLHRPAKWIEKFVTHRTK